MQRGSANIPTPMMLLAMFITEDQFVDMALLGLRSEITRGFTIQSSDGSKPRLTRSSIHVTYTK